MNLSVCFKSLFSGKICQRVLTQSVRHCWEVSLQTRCQTLFNTLYFCCLHSD